MKRHVLRGVAVVLGSVAVYAGIVAVVPSVVGPLALASGVEVPTTVNHQGVVAVNGVRLSGTAAFRFAIVDADTGLNLWTNDGTEVGTSNAPTEAVSLSVTDGVYSVNLGDTGLDNMTSLEAGVFTGESTALRLWFDDGTNGNQQLSPDHSLTSVPYAMTASNGVPVGTVVSTVLTTAPSGWLLCDGSAVSRTTYADLFAGIGTTYGSGDGSTTFNLPDMRGRVAMGAGTGTGGGASGNGKPTGGSALSARSPGDWGGAQTHTLTIAEMPSHSHGTSAGDGFANSPGNTKFALASNAGCNNTTCTTAAVGGGQAHNNIQPFVVLNHIVKY